MQRWWRLALVLVMLLVGVEGARAEPIGDPAFLRVWERTDLPVQQAVATHSWVWGPQPFTPVLQEFYENSPGQRRRVQYFDKSRMEINDPNANRNAPWFVTNGLLVNELVQGTVQVADNRFIPAPAPAPIPIAGDPNGAFPTYADLAHIYNEPAGRRPGDRVTAVLEPTGLGDFPWHRTDPGVEIVHLERGFGVPRAFWTFLNRTSIVYENGQYRDNQPLFDWVFVTGLPTTDAYWTRVPVGGQLKDVLFQAFERRVLTYTPDNPSDFRVEMGNVGQHYYQWRYVAPFTDTRTVVITTPVDNGFVASPLLVQGFESGRAFEGALTVRLKNAATGAVLASANTTVRRADVALAGPFEATLTYSAPPNVTEGLIEVTTTSPADGSERVLATQPVNFIVTFPGGKQALIRTPRADSFVTSPLTVSGVENGTAFEASIIVRLRNRDTGAVLASRPTTVERPDIAKPGPFSATLTFASPERPTRGVVEVLKASPADGSTTVLDSVNVTILVTYNGMAARIDQPAADSTVTSPLVVRGVENGTAFEATILVRLRNRGTGAVLAATNTTVQRPDIGQPGPFQATLTFNRPSLDTPGLIEIIAPPADDLQPERVLARANVTIQGAGLTPGVVTGTITYRPRIALEPGSVARVALVDLSRADAPSTVVSQQTISNPGAPPIPFAVRYDPASIDPTHRYAIEARIAGADGGLRFINTRVYLVITQGHPDSVEIVVEPV